MKRTRKATGGKSSRLWNCTNCCQNIACLLSKNLIQSAKVASYFRRSEEFGITKDNWRISMPGVRERKRKMVKGLIEDQHNHLPIQQLLQDWGKKAPTPVLQTPTSDVGPPRC